MLFWTNHSSGHLKLLYRSYLYLVAAGLLIGGILLSLVKWHTGEMEYENLVKAGRNYAAAINAVRNFYAANVVAPLQQYHPGVPITPDYLTTPGAIPIPASMTLDLVHEMNKQFHDIELAIVSDHPFHWRKERVLSPFDKEALVAFRTHNSETHIATLRSELGKTLFYATPIIMKPSCIGCHNSHPASPKTDWQAGDVRGIQVIKLPFANNHWSIKSSFVYLVGFVSVILLIAFTVLYHFIKRMRGMVDEAETNARQLDDALTKVGYQQQAMDQHAIVSITDTQGSITYANDKFCEISGYSREELLGANHRIIRSDAHDAAFFKKMWQTISEGHIWQGEIQNISKYGEPYWVDSTIVPIHDKQGESIGYASIRTDITARKRFEHRLYQRANFNSQTGLANRDRVLGYTRILLRRHIEFHILLIDLTGLAKVNNSLGFEGGDQIIVEAARRFRTLTDKGLLLGHLGGGQFIFLHLRATEQSRADVSHFAQAIIALFRAPIECTQEKIFQGLNIGIASSLRDGNNPQALLSNAHSAAKEAKRRGTNTFAFFAPEYNLEAKQLLRLDAELRTAISRDELSLYLQPKIDATSGQVMGAEALLRWHSANLGQISPDVFIPVAERSELILEIGQWVINQACVETRLLHEAGYQDFKLALNVSAEQFQHGNLIMDLKQALAEHDLQGKHIELEITESLLLQQTDSLCEQFGAIEELGTSLAIDDFGTGYSSLAYLRKFAFDTLKIDRSFVMHLPDDIEDGKLVEGLLALGHSLGLNVVAEGLETEAQVQFLRERGCNIFQGYYFGRPMPAAEFHDWLRDYQEQHTKQTSNA